MLISGEEKELGVKHNMQITIDIATRNHIRNDPELQITKKDFEVVQKFKYLFEPFKNIQLDEFIESLEEKPAPVVHPQQALISMYDDETEEQTLQRHIKAKEEQKKNYDEREDRFEKLEIARIKRFHLDEEAYKEEKEKKKRQREYMLKKLAEFDDDHEMKKGDDEFYRDNARWWARRQRERAREIDIDKRDKIQEREEKIARERKEEREAREREEEIERQRIEAQAAFEEMQREREEAMRLEQEEQKRLDKMKLAESMIPKQEDIVVTKILTKEERAEAIQKLVAQIPTEKDELFEYPVKWEYMDKVMFN